MSDDPNSVDELRASVVDMIRKRDLLEDEIADLTTELMKLNVTMTEPLVDEEGYPRSDVDIAQVRQIRHDIICKQNDFRDLTDRIGKDLFALHAAAKVTPSASCLNAQEIFLKPFARVDKVDEDSPAQKAGLEVGDLVVKFGSLKYRDFENLTDLFPVAKLVRTHVQRPIHVNVLRNEQVVRLILVPDKWEGAGHLGCLIRPISR